MNFRYRKFPLNPKENPNFKRKSSLRPIIQIDFETKKGNFSYLVLIDSGADFCVFHGEIGERLGFDVTKGDELTFHGTSGEAQKAYFHNVSFKIGGIEHKAYIGFSYEMKSLPYGILGQDGFFDKWRIRFEYDKENIELKEVINS
ncbi:MAG: retropepsin-like aspartic protease [Candidatus Levyibacteriota bacterium]|jgi:predicted aspartyl protease